MTIASQAATPAPPIRRRGARIFASAIMMAQVFALIRFTLLARLLGPEQLGLATTLVLVALFFDSVTDSGNDRFLVQNRDGDERDAMALVHVIALGRAGLIACAMLLMAGPVAAFYHTPALAEGLRWLALAPLINGAIHFDFRRQQRAHDFTGEGRMILVAEAASLVATLIAAFVTRSFTAIVWGLAVRSLVMVSISHLVAHRPYRARYAERFARAMWLFGYPLMLNGILLFLGSQTDRLLIGRFYGLTELGRYSATMLLVFYATTVMQRFVAGMFLPQVSIASPERTAASDRLSGLALLLSMASLGGFVLVAPVVVPLLFGRGFDHDLLMVATIALFQTTRFYRCWPVTIALGNGRSKIVLMSNTVRFSGLLLALAAGLLKAPLVAIVAAFAFGEYLSLLISGMVADRALGLPVRRDVGRMTAFTLFAAGILLLGWAADHGRWAWAAVGGVVAIACLADAIRRERDVLALAVQLAGPVLRRLRR